MKVNRTIWGIVLVFVLGTLSGSLVVHLLYKYRIESIISGRAETREEALVRRLDRKLELSDWQEEQLRAIIHESFTEIKAVRSRFRPQAEAIIEKSQHRISEILTPEQRKKYEQIVAERKMKLRGKGF